MVVINGCSQVLTTDPHDQTVRHGVSVIPYTAEIETMFPGAEVDHFITYFGFSEKPVPWNSVAYWKDRYVFIFQVDVKVDYANNTIAGIVGTPRFRLWEIASVSIISSSSVDARMSNDYDISESEWRKLVTSKGDFSAIGITLKTNSPVSGFPAYRRNSSKGARVNN